MRSFITFIIYCAILAVGLALCWDMTILQRAFYGACFGGLGLLVAFEISKLIFNS